MTHKSVEEFLSCVQSYGSIMVDGEWTETYIEEVVRDAFKTGYQAALKPKWVKLPELPKEEMDYYITDNSGGVYTLTFDGTQFYSSGIIWGMEEILAWAPIVLPEPFREDI